MFNTLDENSLEVVIDAMDQKNVGTGQRVISQGDQGNELYVVEEGSLDCFKLFVSVI
jgi:cAMP-dependent protein kinase regulator